MKKLSKATICAAPITTQNFIDHNNIDLSNATLFSSSIPHLYQRDNSRNSLSVIEIMDRLYEFENSQTSMLLNSGISTAYLIAISKRYKRLLVHKDVYYDMKNAYQTHPNYVEIDEKFSDFQEGDLLCIEYRSVPWCKKLLTQDLIDRAKASNCKICVDCSTSSALAIDLDLIHQVDIVIESLSKLANGLNNSIIGYMHIKDNDDYQAINTLKSACGFYVEPLSCYLTQLGLRTLPIRMKKIQENAIKLQSFVDNNFPDICYTCDLLSGMFYFFADIDKTFESQLRNKLTLLRYAGTFGAGFTVWSAAEDCSFVRVSLGIEDIEDLFEEFKVFFNKMMA